MRPSDLFRDQLSADLQPLVPLDLATGDNQIGLHATEEILISATYANLLHRMAQAILSEPGLFLTDALNLARQARDTSEYQHQRTMALREEIQRWLSNGGVTVRNSGDDGGMETSQFMQCVVEIPEQDALVSAELIRKKGFVAWIPKNHGSLERYLSGHGSATFVCERDAASRVVLKWRDADKPSRIARLLSKIRGRGNKRLTGTDYLGPYLGTPVSLMPDLFSLAKLSRHDKLIDLGCGDGRILINAAQMTGCHGVGVELDQNLVGLARQRVKEAGMQRQIGITEGDFATTDLSDVTVVFMFLPVKSMRMLLPRIIQALRTGGRVIAHEQRAPKKLPRPDISRLLVSKEAVTVAHLWQK